MALVFPAVTINLMHGHNGFLTAALLTGGALLLPTRPLLAGVLLGLLAYKPQFALAVPVALLAGGFFRATVAAVGIVALATLATLAAFGLEPWQAFVGSMAFTRHVVLEQGGPGFAKMQSAFAAVRLLGGGIPLAYAVQGLVTAGVLVALALVWRRDADVRLKAASLMVASLLTTPYALDYDMVVLGPALAALASLGLEAGFRPYGKTLLAAVWIMPLLARPLANRGEPAARCAGDDRPVLAHRGMGLGGCGEQRCCREATDLGHARGRTPLSGSGLSNDSGIVKEKSCRP